MKRPSLEHLAIALGVGGFTASIGFSLIHVLILSKVGFCLGSIGVACFGMHFINLGRMVLHGGKMSKISTSDNLAGGILTIIASALLFYGGLYLDEYVNALASIFKHI